MKYFFVYVEVISPQQAEIKNSCQSLTMTFLENEVVNKNPPEQTENNPSDKRLLNELYATNLRLRALMLQKTKGAILRSRARWQEQGEHNRKYFLNLEKRNHCRKSITKLKINDNEYT